jgi:twinkle protein
LSNCLIKLPHKCGSSDALQVFENDDGTVSGYCFACSSYVPNPLGDGAKAADIPKAQRLTRSKEEIEGEMAEIANFKAYDLSERRLRASALEKFGVKVGLSEQDGKTPRLVYFPYTKNGKIVKYKVRLLGEKRMWSVGIDNDVDLFGWEEAVAKGAKKLIITEGEYDAVAMLKILETYTGSNYVDYIPAVCSLPNGVGNAGRDISRVAKKLRKFFNEIVLCFDSDEAGQAGIKAVLKIMPECKIATLPCKDANEAIIKNCGKAVWKAVSFAAEKPSSTRLVMGSSLREAAMQRPEMGLSWPYPGLTKLSRGIRRGETYYFGAGVKMGKSELVNDIGAHLITEHNLPVLFCKPEEDKAKTYQMLVGKVAGKIFHDPDIEFDQEAFDKAEPLIGDKAIIVDNYQFVDWDNLKDDIRYAVNNENVHDIIIDPVTCFTNHMSASDANEFLVAWAAELAAMAKELQFTSYIFCHLKAPLAGLPHERGGEVLSTQFTGSRAMMRSCHMMIGLEGNKDPELPDEERNIRKLKILEDRNLGSSGIVKLYWDRRTGLFNEMRV